MRHEHSFAQYIKILGKGKKSARSLTREEARAAFAMILRSEAEPIQIGAFLMLLRVNEESADELTGFLEACREYLAAPTDIEVDLDWSSCAGKRKHLPWFILSALLLAENGIRVFMHGNDGHSSERIYTEHSFQTLGLPIAKNWQQVSTALDTHSLCFFPLRTWFPELQHLIDLRKTLGLRSTAHTMARLINPLNALCSVQGIFHPPYAESCAQANFLLAQPNALTIKGDSGEFEYRPEADCKLFLVHNGERLQESWSRFFADKQEPEEFFDPVRLRHIWRGTDSDSYGEAAVIGTTALALRSMNREPDHASAWTLATQLWQNRNRDRL